MSEPGGIYMRPEMADKYREMDADLEKLLTALDEGDESAGEALKASVKAKKAELATKGRGASNVLTMSAEDALDLEPAEGEAIVVVKTIAGTECRKVNVKRDLKYKRISVAIDDIWAYGD